LADRASFAAGPEVIVLALALQATALAAALATAVLLGPGRPGRADAPVRS
jgi:hypothetical protein